MVGEEGEVRGAEGVGQAEAPLGLGEEGEGEVQAQGVLGVQAPRRPAPEGELGAEGPFHPEGGHQALPGVAEAEASPKLPLPPEKA